MFEVGEECQRRALRYLVEDEGMSYPSIVKLAKTANPNTHVTLDRLKGLAKRMRAAGEPLKTIQPANFRNHGKKSSVAKTTEPVENSKPDFEQVQVTVEDPKPKPKPSVPSAGSSAPAPVKQWADDPRLDGWNGCLNELSQKIYTREKKSSRQRQAMAVQLAEMKDELEKTMRAASNSHREKAGALLEADVKMVEATLQKEGRPGIKETLEAVQHEAGRIHKFASETLRVLQLVDHA